MGLAAKAEGAEVHGNHGFSAKIEESLQSFFRTGVDGAVGVGEVGANGEQGDLRVEPGADLAKAFKVGRISAVIDTVSGGVRKDVAAELPVDVVEDTGAPVAGGGHGDLQAGDARLTPPGKAANLGEAHGIDQVLDAMGHDDDRCRVRVRPSAERAMRRSVGRLRWSMWAWVTSTRSISGRSGTWIPARRARRRTTSRVAKTGVDQDVLAAHLDEERRVSKEHDAHLVRERCGRAVWAGR